MGFFKTLFTGKEESEEEKKNNKEKKDFDIFKYDGIQAMRIHKQEYAKECFLRALDIHDDAEVRRHLANLLFSMDDLEGAIEQFERLCEMNPEDINAKLSLAEMYLMSELYDKMEEPCNAALAADPTLARPHLLLAKKNKAQNDAINAIVQSTQAISAKQDYYEAYQLRAEVLCSMGQFAEAEKDIDYIIENCAETEEDIILIKANICAALGKNDMAKDFYNQTIEFNPFIPSAYIGLSSVLLQEKNTEKALETIEEGIEQNPESSELFRARGGIRLMLGDKASAADDMKRALELAPEEGKKLSGKFTSMEDTMLSAYNAINPYNFSVKI